jgi:hypothetical protein
VSGEILAAELVGANPGPAVHVALLGVVVVIALVILGVNRRRGRRAATDEERVDQDLSAATGHSAGGKGRMKHATRSRPRRTG